jgi:hypothetical protein
LKGFADFDPRFLFGCGRREVLHDFAPARAAGLLSKFSALRPQREAPSASLISLSRMVG